MVSSAASGRRSYVPRWTKSVTTRSLGHTPRLTSVVAFDVLSSRSPKRHLRGPVQMSTPVKPRIVRALNDPGAAYRYGGTLLRAALVRLRYASNPRIRLGRGLLVAQGLSIDGPGHVTIGEGVSVDGSSHTVTLPTYAADAEIVIGDGCFINGARFGCARKIMVGRNCILGDCRIMDTNFHSIYPGRRDDPSLVRIAPVTIEDDCWIGAGAFILPGTKIRKGSTVAAGAVVMGRFPPFSVIAGNPARVILSVTPEHEAESPETQSH